MTAAINGTPATNGTTTTNGTPTTNGTSATNGTPTTNETAATNGTATNGTTTTNGTGSDWKPKVIIFDLLTALLNSWELWDASTPSGTPEEGAPWRAQYLKNTFSAGEYVPYETMVKQAAREVGLPESSSEGVLGGWTGVQTWPGTGDVLQQLKTKGYRLGVLTNCSKKLGNIAAQRAAKAVPGGDSQNVFDAVVTAEESGFYKPRPEAYQAILKAMGVEAKDALFVAGSAGDVQGAADAGMKVVWHNNAGLAKQGNVVPLKEGKTLNETLADFL
ncbi:hypothetical protein QQS21_000104 [Conoideocrella luteorostrata]|uniref:HAD-like domain-containing protein n=1 Tax=Conoideocrella luteorostrata TaxID=1105319 RepID=A0AAJ0CZU2_9HYPO|nr:hypothetical protein QQS21_000104 [Conoideocrella luteorostrata]